MNIQRLAAAIALGGIALGAASIAVFGAGAAGMPLPDVPRAPIVAPTTGAAPTSAPPTTAAPASGAGLPVADPGSLDYNPYITPGDPDYVPMEVRAEYLGREAVIAQCMAEQGFEYHVAAWWLGEQAQPRGLS